MNAEVAVRARHVRTGRVVARSVPWTRQRETEGRSAWRLDTPGRTPLDVDEAWTEWVNESLRVRDEGDVVELVDVRDRSQAEEDVTAPPLGRVKDTCRHVELDFVVTRVVVGASAGEPAPPRPSPSPSPPPAQLPQQQQLPPLPPLPPSTTSLSTTTTTTTTATPTTPPPFDAQAFFCRAALRVLLDNVDRERVVLEAYRRAHRGFPAPNEVVACGLLRKSKLQTPFIWKTKYCCVVPGRMYVVDALSPAAAAELAAAAAAASSVGDNESPTAAAAAASRLGLSSSSQLKSIELTGRVGARYIEKRGVWAFELFGKGPADASTPHEKTRYFCADTRADRERWMRAIDAAASPSLAAFAANEALANEKRVRVMAVASAARASLRAAAFSGRDAYAGAILAMADAHTKLTLPVEWVQSLLSRPRGEVDANTEQAFKDTVRDALSVNGKRVEQPTADGVLGALAQELIKVWKHAPAPSWVSPQLHTRNASVLNGFGGGGETAPSEFEKGDEARVLSMCHDVLVATNRTQTGGLMYEAIKLLLCPAATGGGGPLSAVEAPTSSSTPALPSSARSSANTTVADSTPLDLNDVIIIPIHAGEGEQVNPIEFSVERFMGASSSSSSSSGDAAAAFSASAITPSTTLSGENAEDTTVTDSSRKRRHRRTMSDPLRFWRAGPSSVSSPAGGANASSTTSTAPPMTAALLPAPPPLAMPSHASSTAATATNVGVRVRVEMSFKVLFADAVDEPVSVVTCVFSRSFCRVSDRGVALGQGSIDVSFARPASPS